MIIVYIVELQANREKNEKLRLKSLATSDKEKGLDFTKQVLFTDEYKYKIFGNDGRTEFGKKRR